MVHHIRINRSDALDKYKDKVVPDGAIIFENPEDGDTDGRLKIGDGKTPYKDLPYFLDIKKYLKTFKWTYCFIASMINSVLLGLLILALSLAGYIYGTHIGSQTAFELSTGYYDEDSKSYITTFTDKEYDVEYIIVKDGITGKIDVIERNKK